MDTTASLPHALSTLSITHPAAAYAQRLIQEAAQLRLPELFSTIQPQALHQVRDRAGVSVVALLTRDLREDHLIAILRYRLAQYLLAGFVDSHMVYRTGMQHEPLEHVTPGDLHVLAGSAATGEILCYATYRDVGSGTVGPPGARQMSLCAVDRPLLPVEKTFGWGIYNHLPLLPDVPLAHLRELGRFIKNQGLSPSNELGIRAPIEVGAGLFRALIGPLRREVVAVVGDVEEDVAKKNLDFFHCPTILLRDAAPRSPERLYLSRHFQERACFPFAYLTADVVAATPRLVAIEAALAQPARRGVAALLALKHSTQCPPSTLVDLQRHMGTARYLRSA